MLDKGMIHVPGGMEQDGVRFHHDTQNLAQFKAYELFISRIFLLIFSDRSSLWVAETIESKTVDKGGLMCQDPVLLNWDKYYLHVIYIKKIWKAHMKFGKRC